MRINSDISIRNFEAWSGAVETQNRIINEGKEDLFDELIEDVFPQGIGETELNDLLWFEEEWIFESIGIDIEDEL